MTGCLVNDINQVSAINLNDMDESVKRSSGRHHGDLRRALEEAALDLVMTRGVGGFTLAEASRRAGVSVAAPYKHFADRDALLAVLVLRAYEEQRDRYDVAMAAASDPAGQLAAFADAYVQFAADQRALFELTFAAGLDKARHPELAEAGGAVLKMLDAPARALCGDDHQTRRLVLAVAACAHGHAVFLLEGVLSDTPDPLTEAKRQAVASARALAAAYDTRGG
jgi:AcrR family transcriptional regulator